ncbi:Plasma kallikrein-like 4, partial [Homarus americanus]
CGINSVQARILGGHITGVREWPWQVALIHAPSGKVFCGASLLNKRFLLTAAHCAAVVPLHELIIWLGGYDLSLPAEDGRVVHRASHIIIHKDFNPFTMANDVALIRVTEPVNMTYSVRPVCLPDVSEWDVSFVAGEAGLDGTVTGWGLTEEQGEQSKVNLPFLSVDDCKQRYKGINPVSLKMLCTLHNSEDGISRDSCKVSLWMVKMLRGNVLNRTPTQHITS